MRDRTQHNDTDATPGQAIDTRPDRPQPTTIRMTLTDVEARLPIPHDVLITETHVPSGNAWWAPEHRVIVVRSGLSAPARAFALAHETAHIVLDHHGALALERDIETEANTLAAVLLLGAAARPGQRQALRRVLAHAGVKVPT